ncbi:MAG: GFA family protein [Sandaracinus sp.]|nr:GFA family protein [Sandaracinus sp.]
MKLEGSCHCGLVRFSLQSHEPWPYQRCYCSICRKTGGGGGFLINLGGDRRTLVVEGEAELADYRAKITKDGAEALSGHHRMFCRTCGTHLFAWHERWPDLVHPVASAIDTPLPPAPRHVHMMWGSRAAWVPDERSENDETYEAYPAKSLASWHREEGWQE